jgi:hypothetical protein
VRDVVVRFADLYRGRTDLQGTEDGGCLHRPVTFGHFRGHLAGRFGLGIYPLRKDGTCAWAAVDVDQNDLDTVLLLQRLLGDAGLSPLLSTSRSKGYHVTVFVDGWTRAAHLRSILRSQLVEAGLPEITEIYPRCDAGDPESVAAGGYLRLPYIAALATGPTKVTPSPGRRVALDVKTLRPLALEDFLDRAEAGRVAPDLIRFHAGDRDEDGGDQHAHREHRRASRVAELPEDPADLGVKPRVADLIRDGWSQNSGYPSRSEALQAVADALVNSGHDDVTIRTVFLNQNYNISERLFERSSSQAEAEIARCIAKARATSRPSRHLARGGLISMTVHKRMVDLGLPPLAWPVLAEIARTVDYGTGVSIVTMDSLAKRLGRSRASIHRLAIKPLRNAGILAAVPLKRQAGQWQRVGHRVVELVSPAGTSLPNRECEIREVSTRRDTVSRKSASLLLDRNGTVSHRRDSAQSTPRDPVCKSLPSFAAGTAPRLLGETR